MHAKVKLLMHKQIFDTCIARTVSAAGMTVLGIIHMKQCIATVYKSLVMAAYNLLFPLNKLWKVANSFQTLSQKRGMPERFPYLLSSSSSIRGVISVSNLLFHWEASPLAVASCLVSSLLLSCSSSIVSLRFCISFCACFNFERASSFA